VSDDVTGELTARSPRRLLEELAQIARVLAANGRARPEVELYLASGQLLKGRVVEVGTGDDRAGPIAVLAIGGTPRAPAVAYVRIDEIVAVTVADAGLLLRAPVSDAPAPSRLELQRTVAARGEPLARQLGRALPVSFSSDLDDDSRRALGSLLPVLFDVLGGIAGDDMGKLALAAIAGIEIGAGPTGEVWKEAPEKLVLRAPKLLNEAFTAASLRAAIEKLL
jgi:hypothetical protein